MTAIADLIAAGKEFGVFQFYLPLVLSFSITYGILAKINIFGKERTGRNINLIVSMVFSLFVIGATPFGTMLAEYIGSVFTGSMLVVVTILGTMMVLYLLGALIGIEIPMKSPTKWGILVLLIASTLSIGVFVSSGGTALFPGIAIPGGIVLEFPKILIPSIGLTAEIIAVLMMGLGIVAIAWWFLSGEKETDKK
jgi:hypothetical protein